MWRERKNYKLALGENGLEKYNVIAAQHSDHTE